MVHIYGSYVEAELDAMKKNRRESDKHFSARKHTEFLRLTGQKELRQFKNPMATK